MIALDFNNAVFNGSSTTTAFFQCSSQFFQRCFRQRDTANDNNRSAATALGFTAQSHRTVCWWRMNRLLFCFSVR